MCVGKERRGMKSLFFELSFNEGLDKEVQSAVISNYNRQLIRRLDLKKLTLTKERREKNCFRFKLIFRDASVCDEKSFIAYLEEMGFTQIQSLDTLNEIETATFRKLVADKQFNQTVEEQRSKFTAYKQIISLEDYQKLYARLFAVRDEIEQLYYQTGEEKSELLANLREIDFLLENKNLFMADCKFFYLISNKVKKRLMFYSRYLDNLRYSR